MFSANNRVLSTFFDGVYGTIAKQIKHLSWSDPGLPLKHVIPDHSQTRSDGSPWFVEAKNYDGTTLGSDSNAADMLRYLTDDARQNPGRPGRMDLIVNENTKLSGPMEKVIESARDRGVEVNIIRRPDSGAPSGGG